MDAAAVFMKGHLRDRRIAITAGELSRV